MLQNLRDLQSELRTASAKYPLYVFSAAASALEVEFCCYPCQQLLHLELLPCKWLLHEHACICTNLAFTESYGPVACGFASSLHIGFASVVCIIAVMYLNT